MILPLFVVSCSLSSDENTKDITRDISTDTTIEAIEPVPIENLPTYSYYQEEIPVKIDDQTIYGMAFIPEGEEQYPLVILSHGLGGSYTDAFDYAKILAEHGIASYTFDFRGGGGSMSDGAQTDMSVMTEVEDLETVLDSAKDWNFVNPNKVVLFGASHGGIVSAITAARHNKDIAGLILSYPAFLVSDIIHQYFSSMDEIPESYDFPGITLGRKYAEDMWDYDVYEEIGNYKKPVLIMHGTDDTTVPISYSERAVEVYDQAEFYPIEGAAHGFYGAQFDQSVNYIFNYLQTTKIL